MVEENERTDHAALGTRKHASHGKAVAEVMGMALDKKFDRIGQLVLLRHLCCNGTT
jgi:hypothetical protein